jgi:hypothetical protein
MVVYVPTETGHWVNENFARLAEIISDYDPEVHLAWIPPENRTAFDKKPYAVIHINGTTGKQYVFFYLEESELERFDAVLARLFNGDLKNGDPLARIEAEERARKLMELKIKMEQAEERQDFIKSVVGSKKHSFKHKGRVIPK